MSHTSKKFGHDHKDHDKLLEETLDKLREKNIRITSQRRAILEYMIKATHHPTVEEVYNDLLPDYPGLSLATVYNNLNFLVEAGIVAEMKFSNVTSRYDIMLEPHYHILCTECDRIGDFEIDLGYEIQRAAVEQTGYDVSKIRMELYGICPECQKNIESL